MGQCDCKITSIIPADGWSGVYLLDSDPWFVVSTLACWALMEEEDHQFVAGMDACDSVCNAEDATNFYCYVFHTDVTKEAEQRWAGVAQRQMLVKAKKEKAGQG